MDRFGKGNKGEGDAAENRPQPLRQFSDGPSEPPSGLWGSSKSITYWALPMFVLLFIIIAGLYLALSDSSPSREVIAPPENSDSMEAVAKAPSIPAQAYNKISDPSDPAGLLNAYLNVLGGREAVERIQSVRYEGDVVVDGVAKPFRMILSRPDKGMLVTYDRTGAAIKYKLNGDKAWMQTEREDGSSVIKALDEKNVDSIKWSMQVNHTFRRMALARQADGLTVEEIEFMDRPCYKVTKGGPEGSDFMAILDKKSLHLLKSRERVGLGEGEIIEVIYGDYKMISGVMEAHTTQLYRNGELDNMVRLDSIRFNLEGIAPLFSVPDEV